MHHKHNISTLSDQIILNVKCIYAVTIWQSLYGKVSFNSGKTP